MSARPGGGANPWNSWNLALLFLLLPASATAQCIPDLAFGTDWYVEPLDPMIGLYAAVTRQFPDGTPAGGWFGSAYAEFAETRKGSITAGKLADLVVLSKDPFLDRAARDPDDEAGDDDRRRTHRL